jgi:hypothetical protein
MRMLGECHALKVLAQTSGGHRRLDEDRRTRAINLRSVWSRWYREVDGRENSSGTCDRAQRSWSSLL